LGADTTLAPYDGLGALSLFGGGPGSADGGAKGGGDMQGMLGLIQEEELHHRAQQVAYQDPFGASVQCASEQLQTTGGFGSPQQQAGGGLFGGQQQQQAAGGGLFGGQQQQAGGGGLFGGLKPADDSNTKAASPEKSADKGGDNELVEEEEVILEAETTEVTTEITKTSATKCKTRAKPQLPNRTKTKVAQPPLPNPTCFSTMNKCQTLLHKCKCQWVLTRPSFNNKWLAVKSHQ